MTEVQEQNGAPAPEDASEVPERQTTPFLVLQFFIFPMAIVAVCVTVFILFGLIASEGRGPRDYLAEVRGGSANRRWQAAFELSRILQARKDPALSDPRFVSEVIALFDDAERDDPRIRRYLALALGRLGDTRAVPALLKAIEEVESGDASTVDTETQIYAVWALGAIGDPAAVPELVRLAGSDDRGIRKAAVHALGVFSSEEARQALLGALKDGAEDVRWNAAIALARRGDARTVPILRQMMDRTQLASVQGMTPEQQDEAILQAVGAAATLADRSLNDALAALRDRDASLKVREAARAALESSRRR